MAKSHQAMTDRNRLWLGLLSLAAAIGWGIVADLFSLWRQMMFGSLWARDRFGMNLGVCLLLLAGAGAMPYWRPGFSFWWMRCCCAFGLAMVYGAVLSEHERGASTLLYVLCGGTAVVFLLTSRQERPHR